MTLLTILKTFFFLDILKIIYWNSRVRGTWGGSICWLSLQMAATDGAGPSQSQELGASSGSSEGTRAYVRELYATPTGTWCEVKQLALELCWQGYASTPDGVFILYATKPAQINS